MILDTGSIRIVIRDRVATDRTIIHEIVKSPRIRPALRNLSSFSFLYSPGPIRPKIMAGIAVTMPAKSERIPMTRLTFAKLVFAYLFLEASPHFE